MSYGKQNADFRTKTPDEFVLNALLIEEVPPTQFLSAGDLSNEKNLPIFE
jgi:hypothetical protein